MKKPALAPFAITTKFKQSVADRLIDPEQFLNGTDLANQLATSRFAKALEDPAWNTDCSIRYVSLQTKIREVNLKHIIIGVKTTKAATVRGLERAMRRGGDDIPIGIDEDGRQYLFYSVMGYHNVKNLCVIVLKPLSSLMKQE